MEEFELTVLIDEDDQFADYLIEKDIKQIVEDCGGKIVEEFKPYRMRMSYPIKNKEYAINAKYIIELSDDKDERFKQTHNICDILDNDNTAVLKYLMVVTDRKWRKK